MASPGAPNLARAITANMFRVLVGKVIVVVLGLLTLTILTRHLGASGFGHYRTVMNFLSLVSVGADLGLYMVVLREMSRRDADPSRVLGSALALRLVSTTVVLIAGCAISLLLPYDRAVRSGLIVGLLGYVAYQGSELLVGVFQMKLQQGRAVIAEVTGTAVTFVLVWLLARLDRGVVAMIGAMSAGATAAFVLAWILAERLIRFRPRIDTTLWRRLASLGLPLGLSGVLGLVILRGDTLVLSILKPPADVGLYGVPAKILEIVSTVPFIFSGLLMPVLSRHVDDRPRFREYLTSGFATVLAAGAGVAVIMNGFAGRIVVLIGGEEFRASAPALRWLGLAMTMIFVSVLFRFAAIALDRQRAVVRADAAGAVVAVAGYLVLIPSMSYVGAALGSVIAESTVMVWVAVICVRAAGPIPWRAAVLRVAAATLATMGALRLLAGAPVPWPAALIAGVAVYGGVLTAVGGVPRSFIRSLVAGSGGGSTEPG